MDSDLLQASLDGNVAYLHNRLRHDPRLLYRFLLPPASHDTPLHVACLAGKADYALELMRLTPELAHLPDVHGMYPIHIAAAIGHWKIVWQMLNADCRLGLIPDGEGRKLVHVAAACNRLDVETLRKMVSKGYTDLVEARTEVEWETALHTSTRHGHLGAARAIVQGSPQLINLTDRGGNTALHVAREKRNKVIENFLLTATKIDASIRNKQGYLAREINAGISSEGISFLGRKRAQTPGNETGLDQKAKNKKWFREMEESIVVVATVIAGATFQTGIEHSKEYTAFRLFVTVSFGLALVLFVLLASGGSLRHWVQTRIVLIILWASLFFMALAYGDFVLHKSDHEVSKVAAAFMVVVVVVMFAALIGHLLALTKYLVRRHKKRTQEDPNPTDGVVELNDVCSQSPSTSQTRAFARLK